VVTGVDLGKTYTCTVLATNVNGPSPTSQPSSVVVPALSAKPDAPAQPTVKAGNASISVTFTPPFDGGSPITGYTASCTSTNGGVTNNRGGPGTLVSPIAVPGLTNGKTYTCTVQAQNLIGTGPASAASLTAVPKTLPARPAAPTVVAGNARLNVSFRA